MLVLIVDQPGAERIVAATLILHAKMCVSKLLRDPTANCTDQKDVVLTLSTHRAISPTIQTYAAPDLLALS